MRKNISNFSKRLLMRDQEENGKKESERFLFRVGERNNKGRIKISLPKEGICEYCLCIRKVVMCANR